MVQGVAPDAQLIVMKVFGKNGGAYDSDYMAAIEDAVVLGADSVNLSLGSGNPGSSSAGTYQDIMDALVNCGVVVVMSAGNSGYWAENAYNAGYLYADDVSMQTDGSPGSFTNSLTVASVNNDGATGLFVMVDGQMVVYNEMLEGSDGSSYSNKPFSTIAGEQEFIFFNHIGADADGNSLFVGYEEEIEGKIVLCYRGSSAFYQKAEAAVEAGAIGVLIVNNQSGVINMDLTDYSYTQPVASLTQADGEYFKVGEPVDDGEVVYWTGSLTVSETLGAGQYNSDYYTMSSFSSWGVPGSLELKPEITAPGGNIYSINGVDRSGTAYEIMSGTSMAAPQVTGMAALVAQYIRENGLDEQTGLDARTLAQSLLMSTAKPMLADASSYHPVLQQGAGLANVGAAVSADSYILMADDANAGAADGKVKVELGDDPDRVGEYTFSFTLNNLTDVEKNYTLSGDFFIQAPTTDGVNWYMYTTTAMIGADVTWTVDGNALEIADGLKGLDFNGDGAVNAEDGQALLNYATGAVTELTNADKADLDADGDIDSYDAYLFLNGLTTGSVTLPADGSVEITVNVSLPSGWTGAINFYYPNGTYLQGYIYVEGLSSDEGVAGTSHSIPVLGFYGNWSDASMFDVGSYVEYSTGEETRASYLGEDNAFIVNYANEPGVNYYFGGNPMVPDDTYMPERNAINAADTLAKLAFTSIRNAAESVITVDNVTTGENYVEQYLGEVDSAYYYVNGQVWKNTGYTLNVGLKPEKLGVAEGDVLEVGLTLIPEYYVDAEGNVDLTALGEGATFSTPVVIDNTAPVIEDVEVSLMNNVLTVTASDNEYISAVALFNKAGTKVYAYTGAMQNIGAGESAEYALDLTGVNGKRFLVQVYDYAMNASTYAIEMQIGEEVPLPDMIAYDLDNGYWTSFSKNSTYKQLELYAYSNNNFYAATIVDHTVLAASEDGILFAMPEDDLSEAYIVGDMGAVVTDMAYNKADGKVYGVAGGRLVTIDKLTAELEVVGQIGISTNTLACDEDGVFYSNAYGTAEVYSFTLDTIAAPELLVTVNKTNLKSQYVQSMEIDPNTGLLYWTSFYVRSNYAYSYLVEIDTEAATATVYNDLWYELAALIIPEKTTASGSDWNAPTDKVSGMQVAPAEITLLRGSSQALTAIVQPWTVTDRSVTWASADETIATVDVNGVVTAVGAGTTTITATSKLDPTFSATCEVTVETLDITLNGTLQDEAGNPMFFSWNMATESTWTGGTALTTSMTSATMDTTNNKAYIMDAEGWNMHLIDPATGANLDTASNSIGIPLWDMEYSTYFSTADAPKVNGIYYYYFLPVKNPMALDTSAFGLSSYLSAYTGASYLVAVTSGGYESKSGRDTERVIMLDNAGYIWNFWVYPNGTGGYGASISYAATDLVTNYGLSFPGNGDDMYTNMVLGEDGALYVSVYTGDTNELYQLSYNGSTYESVKIGDVGADVWPAILTSVTSNADDTRQGAPEPTLTMETKEVSVEELAAAAAAGNMNRAANAATKGVDAESANAQKPVTGSLNAVTGYVADEVAAPMSVVAEDADTIVVDITAKDAEGNDVDSTNAVITVDFDAERLTLESIVVNGDYISINDADVANGSVTFGYVELDGFAAEDTVATLTFSRVECAAGDAEIIATTEEVNNEESGYEEVLYAECQHNHVKRVNGVSPTLTEPGYSGDVVCVDCGDVLFKGYVVPPIGKPAPSNPAPSKPEADLDVELPFVDVNENHWFYDSVKYVFATGLMNGVDDTHFAPNSALTRGMIVTILYRMEGEPASATTGTFSDVAAGAWYSKAVEWAAANGIVNGYDNGKFGPNDNITREQLVTILYRYAQFKGMDVSVGEETIILSYNDAFGIAEYAIPAMQWACGAGLINGDNGNLMPKGNATRAQVAAIIDRFLNN